MITKRASYLSVVSGKNPGKKIFGSGGIMLQLNLDRIQLVHLLTLWKLDHLYVNFLLIICCQDSNLLLLFLKKWANPGLFLFFSSLPHYTIKAFTHGDIICVCSNKEYKRDGGCGSVGRAVASITRGLWFESSHWQNLHWSIVYSQLCVYWKDEE